MQRRRATRTNPIYKLDATWHRRSKSPQETGQRPGDGFLPEPSIEFPDATSGSPLPTGPTPSTGSISLEYGSVPGSPQACKFWPTATCGGRRFRPGDPARLINSVGFDKASPPSGQEALTTAALWAADSRNTRLLTQFSQPGFTIRLAVETEMAAEIQLR
jgi:hypothetical protein